MLVELKDHPSHPVEVCTETHYNSKSSPTSKKDIGDNKSKIINNLSLYPGQSWRANTRKQVAGKNCWHYYAILWHRPQKSHPHTKWQTGA